MRRLILFLILVSATRACAGAALEGHAAAPSALEVRLWDDAADRQLDQHSLAAAALVAGGVTDAQSLDDYLLKIDLWRDELNRAGTQPESARERAAALHRILHARVLVGGYDSRATDLADLLDSGRFNCLSSATLFLALAPACGLEAHAVESPGHVWIEVTTPEGRLAVETTLPNWDSATAVNTARRVGRPLTDVQLIAAFYHNRGVALLEQGQFRAALAANAAALRLDPQCGVARENLLATLNNWAVALAAERRYEEERRWWWDD